MDLMKLRATLELDSGGYLEGLSSATAMAVAAGEMIADGLKTAATKILEFGKQAVDTGMNFDRAMSSVAAISGATGDELQALRDKAKEMGISTKFSATESAEALTYMAMAGWESKDMISGIGGIMDLAAASGENLASVSDIVTDALTAFGMEAGESGRLADVLAAASSNANTNVGMLGESFKYVAPVAGAMKYSAEDTALALGLMANAGIKSSQAGTALRGALSHLLKPSDEATTIMENLGISMTDSEGTAYSLAELMENLRTSFSGLSEAEKSTAAASLFGTEAMSGMLAIINSSDKDFEKLSNAINDSEGATENMANIMKDSLPGALERFSSAVDGASLALYETFSENAQSAVEGVTNIVSTLTDAFTADGLAGLLSAAESIADNLFDTGIEMINSLAEGATTAIPEFLSNILPKILNISQSLREKAGTLVDTGINLILKITDGFVAGIPDMLKNIPTIISNIAGIINDNAPKLLAAGAQVIIKLAGGIIQNIPVIIQEAPKIIKAISDVIQAFNWLNLGAKIITGIQKGITSMFSSIGGSAKELAKNVNDIINNWDWKTLGKTVIEVIKQGIEGLKNAIPDAIHNIAKTAGELFKNFDWVGLGKNIIQGIIQGLTGGLGSLAESVTNVGKSALDTAKKVLGIHSPSAVFRDEVGAQIDAGVKLGIEQNAGAVVNAAAKMAQSATDKAVDIVKELKERMKEISGEVDNTQNSFSVLTDAVNEYNTTGSISIDTVQKLAEIDEKYLGLIDVENGEIKLNESAMKSMIAAQEEELMAQRRLNLTSEESIRKWDALTAAARRSAEVQAEAANVMNGGSMFSDFMEVGADIVDGIKSGISSGAKNLTQGISNLKDKLVGGVKSAFGIHSPSTLFRDEIGKNLTLGIAEGVLAEKSAITDAMGEIGDFAMGAFSPVIDTAPKAAAESNTSNINAPITINVSGADYASPRELAEAISRELQWLTEREGRNLALA